MQYKQVKNYNMSFNVNFLGSIPINPDNLHVPSNETNKTSLFKDRPVGFFLGELLDMYWTIRSFNFSMNITPLSFGSSLDTFLSAGGAAGGIMGALGGLAAVEAEQKSAPTMMVVNGYTQIVNKYFKKIRKAREGVYNGKTQADVGGSTALDYDENFKPPDNIIECRTFKPNEGTLCSLGPLHRMYQNGVLCLIDFSDILIRAKGGATRYWPKIQIYGQNQGYTFSSTLGYGNSGIIYIYMSSQAIPIYISSNDLKTQFIGSGMIQAGDRCCDRFYWDGKDEERAKEEDCESCSDKIEDHGVYLKQYDTSK
jgi:hypothetical protein